MLAAGAADDGDGRLVSMQYSYHIRSRFSPCFQSELSAAFTCPREREMDCVSERGACEKDFILTQCIYLP